MNFKAGGIIGGYTLLQQCGKGAYGSVFLAENILTKQQVALKIIPVSGRNYERELKGMSQYQSICRRTNLLQIYHVEEKDDFLFYTMDAADNYNSEGEYIPDTLAVRLSKSGRLSPETVTQMAHELLDDLNQLHSKGFFHRDIKPDNVLWINGKATLGDIGLVTNSQNTVLAGTPGFIPAEVLAGIRPFEAEDDFYALGKTIYCALTGLPVSQYPAFPESGTLTGTGEVIKLYNQLCEGVRKEFISTAGKKKRNYKTTALLVLLLLAAVSGLFLLFRGEKPAAPKMAAKAMSPLKPYIPSKEMKAILPKVRLRYQTLMSEMHQAISNMEVLRNTPEDIAKAEKYLEKDPTHFLAAYPEALASSLKQEEARKKFYEKYKHELILEYYDNNYEIDYCKAVLRGKAVLSKISPEEAHKKLAQLYNRQYELEYRILKKYKKNSSSE